MTISYRRISAAVEKDLVLNTLFISYWKIEDRLQRKRFWRSHTHGPTKSFWYIKLTFGSSYSSCLWLLQNFREMFAYFLEEKFSKTVLPLRRHKKLYKVGRGAKKGRIGNFWKKNLSKWCHLRTILTYI